MALPNPNAIFKSFSGIANNTQASWGLKIRQKSIVSSYSIPAPSVILANGAKYDPFQTYAAPLPPGTVTVVLAVSITNVPAYAQSSIKGGVETTLNEWQAYIGTVSTLAMYVPQPSFSATIATYYTASARLLSVETLLLNQPIYDVDSDSGDYAKYGEGKLVFDLREDWTET